MTDDTPEGSRKAPLAPYAWGFRLRFRKDLSARFLSHHDLIRTFERALRRSGKSPAFTQGMNPRPRMSIRPAVALGARALSAAFDLFLSADCAPEELAESLGATLPRGLEIGDALRVPGIRPSPVAEVSWIFEMPAPEEGALIRMSDACPGADFKVSEGIVEVRSPAAAGREPPGARAVAALLWPSRTGPWIAGKATLAGVRFEDGL